MHSSGIPAITADLSCKPEEVGYLPETIACIDEHLAGLIQRKRLTAAAYLISKEDKIIAHRAMGRLRFDDEKSRFLPDSIQGIASITKLFVAVSIMQLVEQGIIRIDQQVKEILSEFDNSMFCPVTIFHLLTHTSGIRPDPCTMMEPYPREWEWFDAKEWIKEALRDNIHFRPGTEWRYSSTGFTILAEIVSRKSGMHFEKYVMEKIVKPLCLADTFFDIPEDKVNRVCFNEAEDWQIYQDKIPRPQWRAPRGGSGLYSTIKDLQKFGQMFNNKGTLHGVRILSRKSVESMTREYLCELNARNYTWGANGSVIEYGLGFNVYSKNTLLSPGSFSHEGSGLCGLFMDPQENLVFAYICPLAEGIGWEPEAVINLRNIVWSGIL